MTNNWLVICQEQNITTQVLQANQHSQRFGLVLTEEDAKLIARESSRTLKEQMRVEFGPGIAQKIIYEFCNSAYLNPNNFTNSIIRLQEIFYLYKNEMEDEITDDELLHLMKEQFENLCFGDLDYLENTCLYNFAQAIQAGYQGYQTSDEPGEYACRSLLPVPHLTTDGYVSACDMALFGKDNNHTCKYRSTEVILGNS